MFENDYLMHYGIKGQKWGVRRYQNTDGSLTSAGRARYSKGGGKRAKYGAEYTYSYDDPDGTSPLKTNKKLLKLNDKIAKNNKQLSKIDAYTLGQLNRYEDTYNEFGGLKDRAYLNGAKRTETARKKYANKDTKLREKRQKLVDKITGTPNTKYKAVGVTDKNDVRDIREAYARGYSAYDPDFWGDSVKAANFVTADWYYNQGKFKDYKVSPDSDSSKGNTYNTRAFNQLKYGKKKRK